MPAVPSYMEHWLEAFYLLSRNRPTVNMTGQPGYIPSWAFENYLNRHAVHNPGHFLDVIQHLDHVYVVAAEKVQAKRNKKDR